MGTTVTLTGSDFDATAENNIVYFGGVRAAVTSATTTSLTVTVPTGATYQAITVTAGGLTGYSMRPYLVTASYDGPVSVAAFERSADIATSSQPYWQTTADWDGDGKLDLATLSQDGGGLSIFRNTSIPGTLSFAPRIDLPAGDGSLGCATGDLDGDGMPDIVIVDNFNNGTVVYRNTSTVGNISFSSTPLTVEDFPRSVMISDIDKDGKPDVIVLYDAGAKAVIYRNTSVGSAISFAPGESFETALGATEAVATDLDGDGKVDLAIGAYISNYVSVLINKSTPGNLSFEDRVDLAISGDFALVTGVATGDLDNDGKMDLVATGQQDNAVAIWRNTSIPGSLSFDTRQDILLDASSLAGEPCIADLDGDGLPEVTISDPYFEALRVYPNQSTPGTIALGTNVEFPEPNRAIFATLADFDGDGRNDIQSINTPNSSFSIWRSKPEALKVTTFVPNRGASGTVITITGVNFGGATAVSIGGAPAASFTVVSNTEITAEVGSGTQGAVSVTTPQGTASLDGFGYTPAIASIAPLSGPVGTAVTITGTNFSAVATDNVVYFGAARAAVTAASETTLTVNAPAGATYQPITVTTHRLTAYSTARFSVTFPSIGAVYTPNHFSSGSDVAAGSDPNTTAIGDLDGDGMTDMAVTSPMSNTLSVFRNISTEGTIGFASKMDITVSGPNGLVFADMDGDGRLDIVAGTDFNVSIYLNQSTPGTLSFAARKDIGVHPSASVSLAVTDLDGDGRPDIVAANSGLAIYRNISSPGALIFQPEVVFPIGYPVFHVAADDVDGDGRPDIAITSTESSTDQAGTVSVFRNQILSSDVEFTSGSLSTKVDYAVNSGARGVSFGDLDGDGKPEMLVVSSLSNNISVFNNTSVAGSISFGVKNDVATGSVPYTVEPANLDGDDRPDIVAAMYNAQRADVLKNMGGSFKPAVGYEVSGQVADVHAGDLDGDGKPDLVMAGYAEDVISVVRNQAGEPTVTPAGTSPVSGALVKRALVDGSVSTYRESPYVQRHYTISPAATTSTANVTLYFTQAEFDAFNGTADHGPDLPVNASDVDGIAALRVYQFRGTSGSGEPGSYSGESVEIDPADADIVWDADAEWWAVTVPVTGLGGFFVSSVGAKLAEGTTVATPTITAGGALAFCVGGNVKLTSSAAAGNQWYKDNLPINGATGVDYLASVSGSYSVVATVGMVSSQPSTAVTVTASPVPAKPTITRNGAALVSSSATGNQWYLGGVASPGATDQSFTPPVPGNYTVAVTQNGCAGPPSETVNYVVTAVVNVGNDGYIKLNPNPVLGEAYLSFQVAGESRLTIQLVDIGGRICRNWVHVATGTTLSFEGLTPGVYIAKLSDHKGRPMGAMMLMKK